MKKCICSVYSAGEMEYLIRQTKGAWNISIIRAGENIIEKLDAAVYDFVLLDIETGGLFPTETVNKINGRCPDLPIFLVLHTRAGMFTKPPLQHKIAGCFTFPQDRDIIFKRIENFFAKRKNALGRTFKEGTYPVSDGMLHTRLIGKSNACRALRYFIHTAANSVLPVLLLGETGCGKDLAAKLIHELSAVKQGSFVQVNVNGIPDTLAESVLFGTEKGGFTGAENKTGVFTEAHNGTLFLNEMESLGLHIQSKILDVIENKSVRAVGASKPKKIDFRLICASNKNLKKLVKQKQFRKDLYFRLDVLRFEIPPLRRRKEDILPLTNFYLKKFEKNVSGAAVKKLLLHSWPGNTRELFNCLERAACFSAKERTIKEYHIEF